VQLQTLSRGSAARSLGRCSSLNPSSNCLPGLQAFADDFCAGGTDGYTCNGDSGGPVVVATESGDVLVGLTSFGPDDCTSPHSYYLRVSDHMDLITAWVNGDGQSGGGDSGGDSGGSWGDLIGNLFCNLGLC
jgi:secreted trypsin-like serine protease